MAANCDCILPAAAGPHPDYISNRVYHHIGQAGFAKHLGHTFGSRFFSEWRRGNFRELYEVSIIFISVCFNRFESRKNCRAVLQG